MTPSEDESQHGRGEPVPERRRARTARPRSHAGAQDARAWLAAIIESAEDAIVGKGLDGIVRSWNPAAERLFGYAASEMVGASILRIIPPELHDEERRIIAKISGGERIERYETTRLRKDGRRIQVSLTISPVRDEAGHVVGASKIVRDITATRNGEQALAQLAAIVESSDDAIIGKDLRGIVTSWNRAAEKLYGYSASEMVGYSALRIVPPGMEDEEDRILETVGHGERVEHYETVRRAKDGRLIEVSLTVSPIRDARGAIIGASKVAREIGTQRAAQRAQAMLAAIVASTDDAIISKDLRGVVTSWNPAAERLYGYAAEEMVGQSILRLIPPELAQEEDHILWMIRNGRRIEHYETTRVHKSGRRIEVSLTISPVLDALGRIVGASKIARDVSGQKEAQRRKDHFLAVLAHELRNPLAPIRNAVNLLGRRGLPEEQRTRLYEIAERQLAHMAHLLDDLLDVSRLATGRVELKRAPVALQELVANAVDATRAILQSRRHQLALDVPAEPIMLHADAVRITQVLINLLTNAAKYTDEGGRISLEAVREGAMAAVTVCDNGIGFAAEMRPRLFTLFGQAEEVLDRAAGGLGIGLAL
ncbi:MAG TPA: PAS domain-containing sensor histidine kinase, partial [Usitatibacter sp.]|nr:PAS domain-containing sensor histidine kinase [Usitatibacter sp.]